MVTGKTKESILVSGHYYCQDHPSVESYLVKNDAFPHCHSDDTHETIWTLKESREKNDNQSTATANGKESEPGKNGTSATNGEHKNGGGGDTGHTGHDTGAVYKRKGFYAALNHQNNPHADEYKLEAVIQSEKVLSAEEIADIKKKHLDRLAVVKDELDALKALLAEKEGIKKEFCDELDKMRLEYDAIREEIKGYYVQLREEIKSLGSSKDDLISKRISKFGEEINKIIAIYQDLEDKQNSKFKKDFKDKGILESDKHFYYDYRKKLETSFDDVQNRVRALEREGLNAIISRFLIAIGWVAAFISSWFFVLWYSENKSTSSGLVIYVMDNLRYFALNNPLWVTVSVFLGYILLIMLIAHWCYRWSIKAKFIDEKNDKKNGDGEDGEIEFNPEKDNLFKSQFRANTWFEMWLKIAPFVAMVFLLVIILAIGSKATFTSGAGADSVHDNFTYQGLSDSLSLQVIGFFVPVAFTAICFLYITKVIEARNMPKSEKGEDGNVVPKKVFSWEILLVVLFFFVLIGLLLSNKFLAPERELNRIGAWGFFVGCLCTGLALGYGYRFISLNESYELLVDRIHTVNRYIDRAFYPFEASYLKDGGILYRMKILYLSLLKLTESRNSLAIKLLNPHFSNGDQDKKKGKPASDEADSATSKTPPEPPKEATPDKSNPISHLFKIITDGFRAQEIKWREKLKEKEKLVQGLEEQIAEIKKDTLDVDEWTYFPAEAAKVKELKMLIDERTKRLAELKEELDGYFKNEKTYASMNQQVENLYGKRAQLAKQIESMEAELITTIKNVNDAFAQKKALIEEGYTVGTWYANK